MSLLRRSGNTWLLNLLLNTSSDWSILPIHYLPGRQKKLMFQACFLQRQWSPLYLSNSVKPFSQNSSLQFWFRLLTDGNNIHCSKFRRQRRLFKQVEKPASRSLSWYLFRSKTLLSHCIKRLIHVYLRHYILRNISILNSLTCRSLPCVQLTPFAHLYSTF